MSNNIIPQNVQKMLDQSQQLLDKMEQKQNKQSNEQNIQSATKQLLKKTAQLPELLEDPLPTRSTAMEFLMRNKGYLLDEDIKKKNQLIEDTAKQVVDSSLNNFFYNNVPDLSSAKYTENTQQHVQQVLSQAAPQKPQKYTFKAAKTQYRTLAKSIKIFETFMAQPIQDGASLFSYAYRGFAGSMFLIDDLMEALKIDNKDQAEALQLIKNTLKSAFSDQKSGEMLLVGETARLRQELYQINILLQKNKDRAKELIIALENKRKSEVNMLNNKIKEVENKRSQEVQQIIAKNMEYGDQVRTLRGILDVIKSDQSVQEVDNLRTKLKENDTQIESFIQQIKSYQQQIEDKVKEFEDFKIQSQTAEEQIQNLKYELKRSEMQKDYCKLCSAKVLDRSMKLTEEIQFKLERNVQIIQNIKSVETQIQQQQKIDDLFQILNNQIYVDEGDKLNYKLDLLQISKELLLIELKLRDMPKIQDLEQDIQFQKLEIDRLKVLEKDLTSLKKLYKNAIAKSSDGMSMSNTETIQGASVTNQKISENQITLLRCQPLFLLLPKLFSLHVTTTKSDNVLSVSSSQVQCIIQQFLNQLVVTCFRDNNSMIDTMTIKINPPTSNAPQQLNEPIQAIFNGWIHQQFVFSQSNNKVQDAELIVNKVAFILNVFSDVNSDIDVDDDSNFLSIGHLIFNQPMTADELQFLLFVYNLSVGGVDITKKLKPIYQIALTDKVQIQYLTLKRAILITQIVLNKAVLKGYFEKFIEQGKQTDMIKDIQQSDIQDYNVCDANMDFVKSILQNATQVVKIEGELEGIVSLVQTQFFIMSLLKAYRTEQLVRIEALRTMYAGFLLDTNEKIISDTNRYRIIKQIIESINPIAPKPVIDSIYLDTIWRSPSGLWAILIDSCRVRGLFSSGLRLPPIDCAMTLVGGYKDQSKDYQYDLLYNRLIGFINQFKGISLHLMQFEVFDLKAIGIQINTILQTQINRQNILMILNIIKTLIIKGITVVFSFISSTGNDLGSLDIRNGVDQGFKLSGSKRLPADIYLDSLTGLLGAFQSILGWTAHDDAKKETFKTTKKNK
ncbi:hypothetical protein SS50377_22187 [Spironucleus salmonicida]|uniref:Uncharacterized protein n=1 Tax=Spironucleus salmonicida TaxID=348837 RepID=V6LLT6_9EUKA|nr:hypothetical protein SS50377_22187 [Spironucleus salmonicida]|eukprot:EST45652.1 hypothetical protein SS50377_14225 [Spironucleus salmonicida]